MPPKLIISVNYEVDRDKTLYNFDLVLFLDMSPWLIILGYSCDMHDEWHIFHAILLYFRERKWRTIGRPLVNKLRMQKAKLWRRYVSYVIFLAKIMWQARFSFDAFQI